MSSRPSPVRIVLGRPMMHVVIGAIFAGLFTWPLLAFESPLSTWAFIYWAWAGAIAVLFALSRGEEPAEEGEPAGDD